MKTKWLNLVLLLSNHIYSRKQQVIEQPGLSAIYNILILIVLEIALGFISLPIYLGTKSEGVTAFLQEKGGYSKVTFDYNLRRVLTLTGVGIIIIIWGVKLALILALPKIYGPLQLYSVSNLEPADILNTQIVGTETGLQTARVLDALPVPTLDNVKKVGFGSYIFSGKGQPNSAVVLLLSAEQTAIYNAPVSANGDWQVQQDQNNFRLSEGNHSILIFTYDKNLGARSQTAPQQYFKVTISWIDSLVKNVDVLANWTLAIIIILGVFLTFLTI
jgi:hypothetical protein